MILNVCIFESFVYVGTHATGTNQHIKEVMRIIHSHTPEKMLEAVILSSYVFNGDTT